MKAILQNLFLVGCLSLVIVSCKKIEPGLRVMQFKGGNLISINSTYSKIDTINLEFNNKDDNTIIINKGDTSKIKTLYLGSKQLIIQNFVDKSYSFELWLVAYGVVQDTITISLFNNTTNYKNQILYQSRGSKLGIINESGVVHRDSEDDAYLENFKINNNGNCFIYNDYYYPYLSYFGSSKAKYLYTSQYYYDVSNFSADGQSVILNQGTNFRYFRFSDSTNFSYNVSLKSGEILNKIHFINNAKNEAVFVAKNSTHSKVYYRSSKGISKVIDSLRVNYNTTNPYGDYDYVEINATGSHILFHKTYYTNYSYYYFYELVLYDINNNTKQIINLNSTFAGAAFNPIGNKFVYSNYNNNNNYYDLYVNNVNSFTSVNITNTSSINEKFPTW